MSPTSSSAGVGVGVRISGAPTPSLSYMFWPQPQRAPLSSVTTNVSPLPSFIPTTERQAPSSQAGAVSGHSSTVHEPSSHTSTLACVAHRRALSVQSGPFVVLDPAPPFVVAAPPPPPAPPDV